MVEITQGDRVAVIGAGTVGSSCAWHLQRAGYRVSLIDPVDPGQSTSFGNAACISPSQITPFSYPGILRKVPGWLFDPLGPLHLRWRHLPSLAPWMWRYLRSGNDAGVRHATSAQARLMHQVHGAWDEILEATGLQHLRKDRGVIAVYEDRTEFERDQWQFDYRDEHGFEWQILSPAELKIMVPALEIGSGMAVYHPDWQHVLDPGGLTRSLAEDAIGRGAQWIRDRVQAVAADPEAVSLSFESGESQSFDGLVVAAGAWSNRIARQLDFTVPMTPKRGYHSTIGDPGIELEYPVMSMTRSFVMTPLNFGLRVAGTAELAKLDAPPDYRRAAVLMKHARDYFPGLKEKDVTQWMGQRPMMADSVPVISRSPSRDRVFYAFGHGHYGLTQGPLTGRLITELVSGQQPFIDLDDYRMDRFRS